jgi:hypothetical protein
MPRYTEVRIAIDPKWGYKVRATNKDTGNFYTTCLWGEVLTLDKAIRLSNELMGL